MEELLTSDSILTQLLIFGGVATLIYFLYLGMQYMTGNSDGFISCAMPFITIIGVGFFFVLIVVYAVNESKEWDDFKQQHNCKVVQKVQGDINTGVGITASGKMGVIITPESDKTAYYCDDGVTYWRNN
ncbi:hypothetical protein M988_4435 [Hafnia paralvei ATCC 29927]|uniref:hypothetical protein n=1 Tax=Hafnia paralvei TaxID=546367 RepID=UPI0007E37DEE|nr:hypothetical protein [Hafnia paralvei]OAT35738.1 hypothetical protein M988_4435 [Hafnia paralvei ATCC 29927]